MLTFSWSSPSRLPNTESKETSDGSVTSSSGSSRLPNTETKEPFDGSVTVTEGSSRLPNTETKDGRWSSTAKRSPSSPAIVTVETSSISVGTLAVSIGTSAAITESSGEYLSAKAFRYALPNRSLYSGSLSFAITSLFESPESCVESSANSLLLENPGSVAVDGNICIKPTAPALLTTSGLLPLSTAI